ncbi:hypothetical protein [Neobacillus cucumis]|uniref:hypothetical protein n=1 Tax=Neobacillus cucumis TaxID=1740721 RepID=UPI001964885A|nr:hypothetical protein [Neobacillus cucumis]MBM7650929.1 hypothetical protein [Neobacillus cucumis]MED4226958.1 hypothetical protein [Neobacillus cucumis]
MKFHTHDKVIRKGRFDGNIGVVIQPCYLKTGLVLVRFDRGVYTANEQDLVLYH